MGPALIGIDQQLTRLIRVIGNSDQQPSQAEVSQELNSMMDTLQGIEDAIKPEHNLEPTKQQISATRRQLHGAMDTVAIEGMSMAKMNLQFVQVSIQEIIQSLPRRPAP